MSSLLEATCLPTFSPQQFQSHFPASAVGARTIDGRIPCCTVCPVRPRRTLSEQREAQGPSAPLGAAQEAQR